MIKAVRGAELKLDSLNMPKLLDKSPSELEDLLHNCDDERIFVIFQALKKGVPVERVHEITMMDEWVLAKLEKLGFGDMPVCMAKTQYSFSDDAAKLGAPRGFNITVREVKVSAGAGFVVALTGSIMTMPGLGKTPAAQKIDVDETGRITGLF